ncbi:bifunctional UDP-sugar hydrolase/5'-nucleotidase periplasmic precursor [compost metagenome]
MKQASIGGQPIDPAKRYRMAINSFMAAGGDGYPRLAGKPGFVDTGFVDADMLKAYISAQSPIRSSNFEPGNSVIRR